MPPQLSAIQTAHPCPSDQKLNERLATDEGKEVTIFEVIIFEATALRLGIAMRCPSYAAQVAVHMALGRALRSDLMEAFYVTSRNSRRW